ncbi:putative ankyrin repeat domain-containing protein 19 [Antechinus flavipes]|uniref:putative ankyrin repeat domain-containing protein 19 n=1 Tax=Antechinus flavipes TaxID=38775 RepID=UPI002235A430|nr:putative ankyrin repeat domain-containing protein 19 [Antechinus flavipes]
MKKIFDFGKQEQFPPCPPRNLPNFFGVQTSNYIPGYVIQSKDLRKIHKAALLGDAAKVQQLLLLGKNNVNDVDREKRTCLHLACANGQPNVVSLLIERKCNLNLLDGDSRTPFMKAIQCEEVECATLLLEHGADPNIGDGNNNALHYVAFFQNVDMTAKLLHYKADIDAKNKEGLTPLFFAIRAKKFDIAEFLLKNGANVNALDGYKRTTLMVAVSMQFTEMVSLLLEYNVDHTIKDELGRSAEKYARTYNYPLHAYVKQIEKHMERNKPCTSQISCSKEATVVPGFVLKAYSLNKKGRTHQYK